MSDSDAAAEIANLVEEAQLSLDQLREDEAPEEEREDLQHLLTIAEEASDLLETIEISELPDTVDGEDLVAAIETGEVAAAIEEGDVSKAVDYRALMQAINFSELAASTDFTELLSESKELKDAVDDANEGLFDPEATGDTADAGDGEESDANEGRFDPDLGIGGDDESLLGGERMGNIGTLPDEAYQVTIQQKAMEAVDEFREGVLEAHDKLAALHEKNREQMRRQHDEQATNSRNPTAHSTVLTDRPEVGGKATHYSTVPRQTKYSTAPSRTRIYGNRFDKRRRKK